MIRRLIIFLVLVLIAMHAQVGPGRAATAPILVSISRDLWMWDGPGSSPKSRTQWGYNFDPVLSPDGKTVAYKSTATVAVNAIKAGTLGGGAGDLPSTIWLLDVYSNDPKTDAKRIANQPANASFSNPNSPDNYILRSEPSWSPDGTELAWTELPVGGDMKTLHYSLIVYNAKTGASKTVVSNIPAQQNYEGYAPMRVLWGVPGIAVLKLDALTDSNGLYTQGTILVYDPTSGGLIRRSQPVRELIGFVWMATTSANDEWAVATIAPASNANTFSWKLFHVNTGAMSDLEGVPELYSPTAPDGLSVYASEAGSLENWQIASQGSDVGAIQSFSDINAVLTRLTISPDGKQIAYVKPDSSTVTVSDGASPVDTVLGKNLGGIAWGQTAWRVRANAQG